MLGFSKVICRAEVCTSLYKFSSPSCFPFRIDPWQEGHTHRFLALGVQAKLLELLPQLLLAHEVERELRRHAELRPLLHHRRRRRRRPMRRPRSRRGGRRAARPGDRRLPLRRIQQAAVQVAVDKARVDRLPAEGATHPRSARERLLLTVMVLSSSPGGSRVCRSSGGGRRSGAFRRRPRPPPGGSGRATLLLLVRPPRPHRRGPRRRPRAGRLGFEVAPLVAVRDYVRVLLLLLLLPRPQRPSSRGGRLRRGLWSLE